MRIILSQGSDCRCRVPFQNRRTCQFEINALEFAYKIANTNAPQSKYQDPWNLFDLLVVTTSLAALWLSFPGVVAIRLVRTLRYATLIRKMESCHSMPETQQELIS